MITKDGSPFLILEAKTSELHIIFVRIPQFTFSPIFAKISTKIRSFLSTEIMLIARQGEVRTNIKKYFDIAFDVEPVIIPRRENRNVVILSETEYKALEKARNNSEFFAKLNRSDEQLKAGRYVVKTFEELEEMAK